MDSNATQNGRHLEGVQPVFKLDKIAKAEAPVEVKVQKPPKPPVVEITGKHLLQSGLQRMAWLVEPFFQQSGLVCLAGSSDTGKSTLLRQLAIDIVTGRPEFLGFKIHPRHRSAIYVCTEDLQQDTARMLYRQARKNEPEDLDGLRFVFETMELFDGLDERLTAKPADVVIIDSFSDAYGGDLKDSQRMRAFLHEYQQLAQKHDCLMLFLHHTGKRTETLEPSKNNLLSGQGFEAKMRLVIEMRADLVNPTQRHLCIVKGNYLPASMKKESFVLEFDEEDSRLTNTHERVPFEMLVRLQDEENAKAKYQQARELRAQGLSYEKIAEKMGYGSKSSVARLFAKAKQLGWDKEGYMEAEDNVEVEVGEPAPF